MRNSLDGLTEIYGDINPKRFLDSGKFLMGVNVIFSSAFLGVTIFVIFQSFKETHPVFALFLSLIYLLFNVGVFYLARKQTVLNQGAFSKNNISSKVVNLVDRSLVEDGLFNVFVRNPSREISKGFKYYPEIEGSIQPLIAKAGLVSGYTYKLLVPQALFSYLFICYSQQQMLFKEILLAGVVGFVLSLVWYVFFNIRNFKSSIAYLKKDNSEDLVISVERTAKQTEALLSSKIGNALSGTPLGINTVRMDTVWRLYHKALKSVFEFNDFKPAILNKRDFFQDSVDDMSYIVNKLLPKRLKAVELFFDSCGGVSPDSIQVFKNEVMPKIQEELDEYSGKLLRFRDFLAEAKEIDKKYIAQNVYLNDRLENTNHINVDAVSNYLYPELRELEFSNLKNKVAAQNISSNLLPELHSLLEIAQSQDDKDKITSQIEDVKQLLFSLSDGDTAKAIENADKNNALDLSTSKASQNLITQTLARQKIYMKSYKQNP